ncbi:MAG: hypothetical protein HYY06_02505 [Deltaproteobacteria bacterium]|nr:hypothetical protein [Deltaproteobacteria bacterium]
MIDDQDNPFDRFGLPRAASPERITEVLRERLEDAAPEDRATLRAIWERLMLHPRDRVLLALGAHPSEPDPSPAHPPPRPDPAWIERVAAMALPPDELVPLPSLSLAVRVDSPERRSPARSALELLLDDPILDGREP